MDKYTKRNSNGSIDIDASTKAYAEALADWANKNETPVEEIESAVESVFNSFPGQRLTTSFIISNTIVAMQATPEISRSLTKRIQAYLKGQVQSGRFNIAKGTGGGITRLANPGEPIPES